MTTPPTSPKTLPESLISAAIQAAKGPHPAYIVGNERDLLSDLWFACNQDMYVFGKRLLEALAAQPIGVIPDGWALKPLEPTKEMLGSVGSILESCPAKLVWMRMNLAAPQPPAGQQDTYNKLEIDKLVYAITGCEQAEDAIADLKNAASCLDGRTIKQVVNLLEVAPSPAAPGNGEGGK